MVLNGKVAVITGASMGIGEALATIFVAEGASVVLSSRSLERVAAARERLGQGDRTLAVACDVRQRQQIEALMSVTLERFGRCDLWVNNAGYGLMDRVDSMDPAACREIFDTNFFAMIDGLQVAAAVMKRQGAGTIINISSVAGHLPLPWSAAYSATKFAMNAMGKAAGVELAGTGVRVMTVCPAFTATNFSENVIHGSVARRAHEGKLRGITAQRVAWATLNGYLRGKQEVVVPWYYHFVIKLYQAWPSLVEWGMRRTMHPK